MKCAVHKTHKRRERVRVNPSFYLGKWNRITISVLFVRGVGFHAYSGEA